VDTQTIIATAVLFPLVFLLIILYRRNTKQAESIKNLREVVKHADSESLDYRRLKEANVALFRENHDLRKSLEKANEIIGKAFDPSNPSAHSGLTRRLETGEDVESIVLETKGNGGE
jgi:hypothetical protein